MAIVHDGISGSKRISGMGKKLGLSGDGDLQQFFRSSDKTQAYYFNYFTDNFPNGGWMKYKPQLLNSVPVGPPTDAQRKAGAWGFVNLPYWTSLYKMAAWCHTADAFRTSAYAPNVNLPSGTISADSDYWKYKDPTQWAEGDLRRAKDFEGAWNLAQCPLLGLNETDGEYLYINNGYMPVSYDVPANLYVGMAPYALQFTDFIGAGSGFLTLSDFYFGVAFMRVSGGAMQVFAFTQSSPIKRYEADFGPFFDIRNASQLGNNTVWRIVPYLHYNANGLRPDTVLLRVTESSDFTGVFVPLPTERNWPSSARIVLGASFSVAISSVTKNSPAEEQVSVDYVVSGISDEPSTQHYFQLNWHLSGNAVDIYRQGTVGVQAGGNFNGSHTTVLTLSDYTTTNIANIDRVELAISKGYATGTSSAQIDL